MSSAILEIIQRSGNATVHTFVMFLSSYSKILYVITVWIYNKSNCMFEYTYWPALLPKLSWELFLLASVTFLLNLSSVSWLSETLSWYCTISARTLMELVVCFKCTLSFLVLLALMCELFTYINDDSLVNGNHKWLCWWIWPFTL